MKINVKVKPGAKSNKIVPENDQLVVYLTDQPEKGKANKKLIAILSDYYNVSKSQITILRGQKSKEKLVDILE